jgi:hypothetical protein
MSIQTTNPANEIIQTFDEMTDEQVDAAIAQAEPSMEKN